VSNLSFVDVVVTMATTSSSSTIISSSGDGKECLAMLQLGLADDMADE